MKVAVASETASPQTIQDLEESSLIFRCSSCAEEFPISINDGVRLSETCDCDLCGSGLVTFRCFRPATDRSDLRRRAPGGDPAPLPDDSDADAPEGRRMAPSDPASPRDDAPGGAGNERSEPQEPQEPADDSDDSGWGTEQEPGPARLACWAALDRSGHALRRKERSEAMARAIPAPRERSLSDVRYLSEEMRRAKASRFE